MKEHPIRYRPAELVAAILGTIYDSDDPYPWLELVHDLSDAGYPTKTVENVLYELDSFGAIHRIGKPADRRRPDTRALRPTPLGRAWLDQQLLPLHHHERPDS